MAVSRTTTVRVPPRQRDRSIVADLRLGFDTVVRSPLMRLVAIAYVLLAILGFSVTYPFLLAASETFTTEADLATALGVLSAAVTATSFVVSVVLANRVYARFGVTGAALLLPIVYLGGFAVWLVAFSFSTAALFRFTQQVTQRGVSNSAWSAFYNVVPRERRAQVLAFNDGVPGQVGTILSGFLLLAAGTLLALDQVFWLGVITAIVCTIVVAGIRRRYRASVLESLRTGLAEQVLEGGPGSAALARDPAVSDTLITALAAPEPAIRLMAARLLAQGTVQRAGPALIRVVDDDLDPACGPRRSMGSRRWVARRARSPRRWHACSTTTNGSARRPFGPWRRWASMPRRSTPTRGSRRWPTTRAPASVGHSPASTARMGRTRGRPRSSSACWPPGAMRHGSSGSKRTVGWAARYRPTP